MRMKSAKLQMKSNLNETSSLNCSISWLAEQLSHIREIIIFINRGIWLKLEIEFFGKINFLSYSGVQCAIHNLHRKLETLLTQIVNENLFSF